MRQIANSDNFPEYTNQSNKRIAKLQGKRNANQTHVIQSISFSKSLTEVLDYWYLLLKRLHIEL